MAAVAQGLACARSPRWDPRRRNRQTGRVSGQSVGELTGILSGTGAKMKGEILHDVVRFRGAFSADVPFDEIVAEVRGTLLVLSTRGHVVELGAGAKAQSLASQVRNPPSRLDRLQVEYGVSAAIAGSVDPAFRNELGTRAVVAPGLPREPVQLLFFGAATPDQLAPLPKLAPLLAPGGILWLVHPALPAQAIVAASKAAGLTKSGEFRFSPTHTATRLVRP